MRHHSLEAFLETGADLLQRGPLAVIMAEDEVEVASTLRHHLDLGFRAVLLLAPPEIGLPAEVEAAV